MKILKIIGTIFFSILLFIALVIFCVAFFVNGTALNNGFVTDEVDQLPVSSIARDIAEGQIDDQFPEGSDFLKDVAYRVIENQEPWVKTQLKNAINTGYDYFYDRTDYFTITIPLTELKTDLSNTLWPEAEDYLSEELAGKSDAEISDYLQDIIDQIPSDILPPDLAILPEAESNKYLEQYLRSAAGVPQKSGYPVLDPATKADIDQTINQYISDFISGIPDSYTVDESTMGTDGTQALQNAKQGVGYFQNWYPWLIVLLFVLAGLIYLVNWGIKIPTRAVGIVLFIVGVIFLVGIIVVRTLPITQWVTDAAETDISPALQTWIQNLVSDVTGVLLPLTIGLLVGGVILIVVSIILPKREKAIPIQESNYPTTSPPPQPPPAPTK
jgi:hypothetical protein